jgi:hypothetical protein
MRGRGQTSPFVQRGGKPSELGLRDAFERDDRQVLSASKTSRGR